MTRRNLTVAFAIVLLHLSGGCGPATAPPVEIRPVRAMRAGEASQIVGRWFPGRAKATQEVNIAFEVAGKLVERPVDVGDRIDASQVLASLDPRDFQNDLDAARAQEQQAVAYRERIEQAAKTGAVAQQDLTDAVARFDVAKANVSIKEKALADSRILAPFSGTIAATYVENFQNVRMKQPVLRLLDTTRIEMTIHVPENSISLASSLTGIKCRFDAAPGRDFPAEIKELGTEASETTRTYPVTLIMDQPEDFTVLPGMTGEASATRAAAPTGEAASVVTIPVSAVSEGEGGKVWVWILEEAEADTFVAKRQEITTVRVTSFGIEVKGLQRGLRIATAGAHYLREGQKVRLLKESVAEVTP